MVNARLNRRVVRNLRVCDAGDAGDSFSFDSGPLLIEQNKNKMSAMSVTLLDRRPPPDPALFPDAPEPLEEAGAAEPADASAAFAFALSRLAAVSDPRPVALVTTGLWRRERGRPFARGVARWGLSPERLIWIDG